MIENIKLVMIMLFFLLIHFELCVLYEKTRHSKVGRLCYWILTILILFFFIDLEIMILFYSTPVLIPITGILLMLFIRSFAKY